jgi:hypothetical protein
VKHTTLDDTPEIEPVGLRELACRMEMDITVVGLREHACEHHEAGVEVCVEL